VLTFAALHNAAFGVAYLLRPLDAVGAAVTSGVVNAHGLALYDVVLVRAGALPRTTSGKVQRRHCRELYCERGFGETIHQTLRRLYGTAAEPS
jgi:acyl-CoA synthetase (AMP-forming)/AMP-acid ligase II